MHHTSIKDFVTKTTNEITKEMFENYRKNEELFRKLGLTINKQNIANNGPEIVVSRFEPRKSELRKTMLQKRKVVDNLEYESPDEDIITDTRLAHPFVCIPEHYYVTDGADYTLLVFQPYKENSDIFVTRRSPGSPVELCRSIMFKTSFGYPVRITRYNFSYVITHLLLPGDLNIVYTDVEKNGNFQNEGITIYKKNGVECRGVITSPAYSYYFQGEIAPEGVFELDYLIRYLKNYEAEFKIDFVIIHDKENTFLTKTIPTNIILKHTAKLFQDKYINKDVFFGGPTPNTIAKKITDYVVENSKSKGNLTNSNFAFESKDTKIECAIKTDGISKLDGLRKITGTVSISNNSGFRKVSEFEIIFHSKSPEFRYTCPFKLYTPEGKPMQYEVKNNTVKYRFEIGSIDDPYLIPLKYSMQYNFKKDGKIEVILNGRHRNELYMVTDVNTGTSKLFLDSPELYASAQNCYSFNNVCKLIASGIGKDMNKELYEKFASVNYEQQDCML